MRHFFRTQIQPDDVLATADKFFPTIGLQRTGNQARARTFGGALGTLVMTVKKEGGHYTFVEVHTDQMGESRLDRNTKKFFVELHRMESPSHALEASY
ncbi:MAG TPA: hypothetical protein VNU46_09150 [Gemmatimonadaceae bacterium]|nr:hypothetical protein [Gemmatimonadaceae bacterium]